jgi:hypothetical protein
MAPSGVPFSERSFATQNSCHGDFADIPRCRLAPGPQVKRNRDHHLRKCRKLLHCNNAPRENDVTGNRGGRDTAAE